MGKLVKLLLLLIIISFGANSFAAPAKGYKGKSALKKIKQDLGVRKKQINELSKDLSRLEKNLGAGNKRYLHIVKKKKEIEFSLFNTEVELKKYSDSLKKLNIESHKVLSQVLANNLENQEGDPGEMLAQKVLKKLLKSKLQNIKDLTEMTKGLQSKLISERNRFNNFIKIEREILTFMRELENKKKYKADSYVSTMKQKEKLQSQLSKMKTKIVLAKTSKKLQRTVGIFDSPLEDYSNFEYGKKGITYKFKKQQPVTSSKKGTVIYVGRLSTYGNVVMVDHGGETKSIFLGQFLPKVKKGHSVQRGQLLGYTTVAKGTEGKLYFEVRKRDKAQNTIQLINQKSLAKNKTKTNRS